MKLKKIVQLSVVIFTVFFYFFNSDSIVNSVKEGMLLCFDTVIPSLYIFMVLASVLSEFENADILSFPFVPLFRLLNITNRRIMTYCVLSIMGGFATGGYFLNRIDNEFCCEKNFKCILLLLTSNNSPAFIIVATGLKILGSLKTGILLYLSVLFSCYATAFILSFFIPYSDTQTPCNNKTNSPDISRAVKSSVNGILNICGVVILAFTACKVVSLYIHFPAVSAAFSVLCEVTTACSNICALYGNNLYLICTAVTVFPLSAYFQMKSFDKNNSYSFKILFLSKLLQVPLCISFLRIMVNIFPVSSTVYAAGDIQVNSYWHSPHISLYLMVLSVCFVIAFDKKTGVFTKTNK